MNKFRICVAVTVGALTLAVVQFDSVTAQQPRAQYAAVLTVKNMCCAKESVPAIRELSKIKGAGRVSVDYKSRSVMIEPTATAPSPRAIWEAAERIQIEPIRLATPQGVYTSKPRF